ncbi:MAG: hypothetical protein GY820_08465, partial [Gammaproteobacteria bacterium]|nr:hypothetical protein [Gammaproteobacteria bacterium]
MEISGGGARALVPPPPGGAPGCRPSESVFAQQRTTYTWALACWIDQLPNHLKRVWEVVKANADEAKEEFTKQYNRKREVSELTVGDSVLWFRPQDVQGETRKFAMPYVGPYVVLKVSDKNTA